MPASLHSVNINYDNLKFQRTHLYGNLVYKNPPYAHVMEFKELIRHKNKYLTN